MQPVPAKINEAFPGAGGAEAAIAETAKANAITAA